ncbi:hypothetical protein PR048_015923 [Dryococelus australis]|uniref:Set2 Rpb1 interacting domain-containing protein n=1 Tax=Dryococelus australis TaxID=614101 RepID=A0ABQ9HIA3_9NEOP|nr:hypothetical protein PR048_015923 [Dryococelus australis]
MIPNTRQMHQFLPFDCNSLKCYITSSSQGFQVLNASTLSTDICFDLKKKDYIACMYNSCWWLAEVNAVQEWYILYGCHMKMSYVFLHLLNYQHPRGERRTLSQLTHFVMVKELRHCRSVEDLECNENVKHKARDFVKKYMTKYGPTYERPKDDN